MEGKDGQTQKPTAKKRNEARRDGTLCISQEINSMVVLLLIVLTLRFACPMIWRNLALFMTNSFKFDMIGKLNMESFHGIFMNSVQIILIVSAPVVIPAIVGAIASNMTQTKPYFSTKTLKFRLSPLNPIKGMKKLISLDSIFKLLMSLLKIALIVTVASLMVRKELRVILHLSQLENDTSLRWMFLFLFSFIMKVTIIFVFIAILDWIHKKYKHEKGLLMTKQQITDERKQEEVNPLIKRTLFKRMREFSFMRMMAAVPNASVVITNPTHVAVALEYDPESMDAPKVTAKGLRLVAHRIKKIAKENNIPIIEKPQTARDLYKHVSIGREIPSRFFEAVAETLAYLHKLGHSINDIES